MVEKAAENETLEDIKRLLIVLLLKLGSTSDEIAVALNVTPGRVRQVLPTSKIKKIVKSLEE